MIILQQFSYYIIKQLHQLLIARAMATLEEEQEEKEQKETTLCMEKGRRRMLCQLPTALAVAV